MNFAFQRIINCSLVKKGWDHPFPNENKQMEIHYAPWNRIKNLINSEADKSRTLQKKIKIYVFKAILIMEIKFENFQLIMFYISLIQIIKQIFD